MDFKHLKEKIKKIKSKHCQPVKYETSYYNGEVFYITSCPYGKTGNVKSYQCTECEYYMGANDKESIFCGMSLAIPSKG
jgi:hypothetical protein